MSQVRTLKPKTWWDTFDAISSHLLLNPAVQLNYSNPAINSNFRKMVCTATDAMLSAITDAAIVYTIQNGDQVKKG